MPCTHTFQGMMSTYLHSLQKKRIHCEYMELASVHCSVSPSTSKACNPQSVRVALSRWDQGSLSGAQSYNSTVLPTWSYKHAQKEAVSQKRCCKHAEKHVSTAARGNSQYSALAVGVCLCFPGGCVVVRLTALLWPHCGGWYSRHSVEPCRISSLRGLLHRMPHVLGRQSRSHRTVLVFWWKFVKIEATIQDAQPTLVLAGRHANDACCCGNCYQTPEHGRIVPGRTWRKQKILHQIRVLTLWFFRKTLVGLNTNTAHDVHIEPRGPGAMMYLL